MVANRLLHDKPTDRRQRPRVERVLCAFFLLLSACTPQSFFFYPNRVLYNDPDRFTVAKEVVSYPSLNGKKLYALYFQTDQKPLGTIVHFHGNFGNVSNHFPLALFLTHYGFDVLSFDYEGYGASEGHPSTQKIIDDGVASVAYAHAHSRAPGGPVALFGQSLGAGAAIDVAAREPMVRAVVAEAPFAGYRAMARTVMSRHVLTWPLYIFLPFIGTKNDPLRSIAAVSPRPIFLIHGDADTIVPYTMSQKLFAAAREPKRLWIVPGAGHLEVHRAAKEEYETSVTRFFADALQK